MSRKVGASIFMTFTGDIPEDLRLLLDKFLLLFEVLL